MSIDPTNFEPQGMPTREQVQRVWTEHPDPSVRNVADKLTQMGYKIGYRTVARWKKAGWKEPDNLVARDERCKTAGEKAVDKALRTEVKKIEAPKGIEAAVTGTSMTDEDLARIEAAKKELGAKTLADLYEDLEKERVIHNIILLRESSRKANVLALIPKDTSLLVGAFSEDANKVAAPAPILPPNGPGQSPALNGNGNGHAMIEGDFKVVNPTSAAIRKFLAKENA